MGVTAEELYGNVPLLRSDRPEDGGIFWGAEWDMPNDEEEVDFSVAHSLLEPLLFDRLFHILNDSITRVACKVVKEAKCQNANTLILGCKLFVPLG